MDVGRLGFKAVLIGRRWDAHQNWLVFSTHRSCLLQLSYFWFHLCYETVQFTTIYPGWYQGRAIHIHVKVRTFEGSNETLEWTSQFYLNNSINEQVHTQTPHNRHGPVDVTNEGDFIYTGPSSDSLVKTNTGQHLMLKLNKYKQGYIGTFNIGLNANQSR